MAEPREPRMTIAVDHSPPTRTTDGRLRTTFWAIAQEGRNRQIEDQSIEFLVNDHLVWSDTTLHDGRTADHEYLSDPGITAITLEAQTEGDASKRSRKLVRLEVKTTKPESVVHFKMKDAEHEGNGLIVLWVRDGEANPVQGQAVQLLDKTDSRMVFPVGDPTDKSGMMRFTVSIEPKRDITALVHGLEEKIKTSEFQFPI